MKSGCASKLDKTEIAAYDAPFPGSRYKVAARLFPGFVPTTPADPERANNEAWEVFKRWEKPFLTLFSSRDPITRGGERAWQELVPDQDHTVVTAGYGFCGQTDYVTAAGSADGSLVMAYVPPTKTAARRLRLDMSRPRGRAKAQWFNPGTGSYATIHGSPFPNAGPREFITPGENGTGLPGL